MNQVGELTVVLYTEKAVSPFVPLKIISNSRYVIDGLTHNLQTWEKIGYIGIDNKKPLPGHSGSAERKRSTDQLQMGKGL